MSKILTPIQAFLAPLAKLAAKYPDLEAEVIWASGADWAAQDDASELLDAEEIAFYAEGLLMEGFCLQWQVFAETAAPAIPAHARLFFWQGLGPQPPQPEDGLTVFATAAWNG